MNRSRSIVIAIVAAALVAGALYWSQQPGTEQTQVGQKPASGKAGRRGGAAGGAVPVVTADSCRRRLSDPPAHHRHSRIARDRRHELAHRQPGAGAARHATASSSSKGDLLFTLDDREIQALIARDEAQLAKDKAALTQAEADLARKQELIEKNVAPAAAARPGDRRLQGGPADGRGGPGGAAGRPAEARLRQARGADHRPRRRHPRDAGQSRRRQRCRPAS